MPLEDVIFDVVQWDLSATVALPMTSVQLNAVKSTWEHPSSAPVSFKRLDHMYRVQEISVEFLFTHPHPNSLIVSSSTKSLKHQFTLPDKGGKCFDCFGHRFYSLGSLGIKGHFYLACIACYMHAVLENFSDLFHLLSKATPI